MTAQSLAPRPTALRGLLALLAASVLAILGALPASAHASLVRSSPESGATLTAAPPEVALTFNEEINPQFATVTVKAGDSTASTGDPEVDGTTVYQPLDPEMTAGKYTVAYRVTSADGHPVSGSFDFTYAPAGGDEGEGETGASTPSTSDATSTSSTSSTTSEDSGSATSTSAGSSEPSSTSSTSATSESTSTSDSTSTEPTSSASTSPEAETTAGGDDGLPWWVWVLGLVTVLGLVGGTVLVLGRRGDEELDLESYGRPDDGDDALR